MIVRGFKSVLWVGAVGSAALSCYMVSLRVATERADLARVEGQIVDAKRDIRTLETELGTRGRLAQLEDWNTNVLALSAPSSGQFVKDAYTLARLQTHEPTVEQRSSEVRMASLETGQAPPPKAQAAVKPQHSADPDSAPASKAAPDAAPLPRVVEAVAAAPAARPTTLVHRASYTPSAADETAAADAGTKPAPTKKVKAASNADDAAASEKHEAHRAERTAAATDKSGAKKPRKAAHAAPKLARADAIVHVQASGHRGGAQ
jgi:hypothetical protein